MCGEFEMQKIALSLAIVTVLLSGCDGSERSSKPNLACPIDVQTWKPGDIRAPNRQTTVLIELSSGSWAMDGVRTDEHSVAEQLRKVSTLVPRTYISVKYDAKLKCAELTQKLRLIDQAGNCQSNVCSIELSEFSI